MTSTKEVHTTVVIYEIIRPKIPGVGFLLPEAGYAN